MFLFQIWSLSVLISGLNIEIFFSIYIFFYEGHLKKKTHKLRASGDTLFVRICDYF